MQKTILINTYVEDNAVKKYPKTIEKGWGWETVLVNNDLYCGKKLHFNKGAKFSMHFHIDKDESFYVDYGRVKLTYYNLDNADMVSNILIEGDSIRIPPHVPHMIEAEEETEIIETSTTHRDEDSYRILKGDSQR